MINRLNKIANEKLKATSQDINFYAHELRESELIKAGMHMKKLMHKL